MYNAVLVRKETKVKQANVAITGTVNLKKNEIQKFASRKNKLTTNLQKKENSVYICLRFGPTSGM